MLNPHANKYNVLWLINSTNYVVDIIQNISWISYKIFFKEKFVPVQIDEITDA